MLVATVVLLSTICRFAQSSEFHPITPAGAAPIVTAASSQYFERTFNRLVAAPALQPVFPVAPAPPVVIDAKTTITPVIPTNPPQPLPADPNIAIAIATAQAAAPVATILLPPYPFAVPSTLGLIPAAPPFNIPSENPNRESTTQKPTTVQATTTQRDLEVAPLPSNNDNSFAQALPGNANENTNFRHYLSPPRVQPVPQLGPGQQLPRPGPLPGPGQQLPGSGTQLGPGQQLPRPGIQSGHGQQFPRPGLQSGPGQQLPRPGPLPGPQPPISLQPQPLPAKPIKLKTTVEVVPVPLTYIAPPPMFTHAHIHSHEHNKVHAHVKIPKHVHFHTYIPKKTKIIIRPVRLHSLKVPDSWVAYKPISRSSGPRYPQNALRVSGPREREPTTFRPINRPMTKPPRI